MISVNATYNTIIANGGQFEWQIVNGANTFSKANLMSGSISSSLCEGVAIGSTISAQLDISLYDVTVDTTNPLVVQFRATDGTNDSSWYTKGTFYIDTLETSPYTDVTKITAFDSMLMTEYVYQLQGEWQSVTDLVVLNKITGFIGISLESATQTLFSNNPKTLTNAPNIGEDGTTAREVLSYIGALRGGNWRITPDNKLQLIILSTSPTNTANVGDAVTDVDASPAETVKKVRVWINDTEFYAFPELPLTDHSLNPITTHTLEEICIRASEWAVEWEQLTGRTIDVQIPFWCDYAAAKAIYTQFKDLVFYPYNSSTAFVPPEYEIGDGIVIKTTTSIIASQTIEISPLASSSVELKKDEMINSLYPYKAPFKRKTNYQMSKNTAQIAENTAQIAENTSAISAIPESIQRATTLITGGFGGYLKYTYLPDGTPSELLIMDNPSEENATNIIRLNRNGLGFSTDGGATYANAWTIDGRLNADFIQTGTLSADRIGANSIAVGKLSGSITNGDWNINLTNGTMTIGSLAVGSITGSKSLGNNWSINFDTGVMNIGSISADNITSGTLSAARIGANSIAVSKLTGSISNGSWKIDLENGTFTIGNISADNINTGTLTGVTISGNTITGGTISGSTITSTGTYTGGWEGTTKIYNGTFESTGTYQSYTATLVAEATGMQFQNIDGNLVGTVLITNDPNAGSMIQISDRNNGVTTSFITLTAYGINTPSLTVNNHAVLEIH